MELISKENQERRGINRDSLSTPEETAITWQPMHLITKHNTKHQNSSNISILTTKYDDFQEKITFSEKKFQKSNHEDSILEVLKSRGLLDCSIEKKIYEYNLSVKGKEKESSRSNPLKNSFISLLQDYRIIQKNNAIADTQLENLEYMNKLKNKKIEIMENAKNAVQCKVKANNREASRKKDIDFDIGKSNKNDKISNYININNNFNNDYHVAAVQINKKCYNNSNSTNSIHDDICKENNDINNNYEDYLVNSIKNVIFSKKDFDTFNNEDYCLEIEKLRKVFI